MYRQCTTEKTATQQRIFHDALYQALQDQPYSEISITDLCNHTGLSRNIFYRLFDCKDDVLYALIDNRFFECAKKITDDTPRENLLSFYRYWKNQKDFLDILKKNRIESFLSIRGAICCCRINFGMQKLIHRNWDNYDTEILSFYASGFIGLLLHWYQSNFSRSVEEMADVTLELICHSPIILEKKPGL